MQSQVRDETLNFQFWSSKKLPVITHEVLNESGLTCLAMIAGYYGHQTRFLALLERYKLFTTGNSFSDIIAFSEQLQLSPRSVNVKPEAVKQLKAPAILQWEDECFVVLKSVKGNKIIIHHPVDGEKILTLELLQQSFHGLALELMPNADFAPEQEKVKLKISDFWTKVVGLKSSMMLVFSLSLLLQVFILASPYYIQLVIDDVIVTSDHSLLLLLAVGFFLVLLFEVVTNTLRKLTLLQLGNQINVQLGGNLFNHLIRLPLQYFTSRHMGDIVSRFGSLEPINRLLTHGVIEAVIDGLMALVTLMMILFYSPLLTLFVVIAITLSALIRIAMYKPLRDVMEQEITAEADENTNFMESVRGIQTIKLFGSEGKKANVWRNHHTVTVNKGMRLGSLQISQDAADIFLFGLENIVVVFVAAGLVINGGFSVGMLFAFLAYKNQFISKTSTLIEHFHEFKVLGLHFERLADIIQTPKEQVHADILHQHDIKGKVELKDLSFKYHHTGPQLINQLNLVIEAGESVAITGPSASGKSTLLKLMLGLNDPEQGQILIDDTPLELIGKHQYRQQVAAVMQDDVLLSGTVADNIAFFEHPIDMEHVVYCAELAAIDDDISKMPMGYHSVIADMGSRLSGGQKQRIILARALYKNPKILFMDEATSHLDTKLEADINAAIKFLDMTRVIVAHRKETIASADRVVELQCLGALNQESADYQHGYNEPLNLSK